MEDHSFTFIVESVHLFLSTSRSKHLCELCIDSYILAYCTYYITLCWQYPWDIHVTSWKQPLKLNLPLCCFNAFTLNLLLYELTLMQDLLMLVLKVLFMKSLCFVIHLFTHVITIVLIATFITYAYDSMIKVMMACHSRNYLCYRLPARDEQELSLGMLIRLRRIDNFLCSMPHYWWYLHVLCTLYVIFVHFLELTY